METMLGVENPLASGLRLQASVISMSATVFFDVRNAPNHSIA